MRRTATTAVRTAAVMAIAVTGVSAVSALQLAGVPDPGALTTYGLPAVTAIGEVAAIEGRCYGLVGPGYTSAEVVADRLLGGAAEFGTADMSTKLKLLGVDVASFGDAMGATPGCLDVVVNDAVAQTYGKLVRRQL